MIGENADRVDGRGSASAAAVARAVCPFLVGEDGTWRSAIPVREHRCGAVEPSASLSLEKQRRLCITSSHMSCATYLAARGITLGAGPPSPEALAERVDAGATRWLLARTSPLLLDRGGGASVGRLARRRTAAQIGLGALMALALAAVVLARLPERPAVGAGGAATASPQISFVPLAVPPHATPSARPTPSQTRPPASPTPSANGPASTAGSVAPNGSAEPTGAVAGATATPAPTTYTVVSGDTLYGIAIRFGTTVAAIQDANEMGTSTRLRVGQVLQLP